MKTLVLVEFIEEPETWKSVQCDNVLDHIMETYNEFPSGGRFYYDEISEATDITPKCEEDLDLILQQDRIIFVLWPTAVPVIIAIVAVVVGVAVAYFMMPSIPGNTQKNTNNASPNNELSSRTNKPRPNSRIPDPFGVVRSTPDLLGQPYTKFVNHQEVEICYVCFGRGAYDIKEDEVFDDTTMFKEVAGASFALYDPFTSPNSGDVPRLQIGDPINIPVETVYKVNSVNGQTTRSPNDNQYKGKSNIRFVYPNTIELLNNSSSTNKIDFTKLFNSNDILTLQNAQVATGYTGQTRDIIAYSNGSFAFAIPTNAIPAEFVNGGSIKLSGALFQVKDVNGYVTSTYDLSGTYSATSITVFTANEDIGTPENPNIVVKYYLKIQLQTPALINPKWSVADGVTSTSANVSAEINSAKLSLDGVYTVTSVSEEAITLSNPRQVNANWNNISTTEYTSAVLSTSGDKWVGPFTMPGKKVTSVSVNYIANNGLFKDDGSKQERVDVVVELELQRVTSSGEAIGDPILNQVTVQGSETSRTTRAVTLRVDNLEEGIYKIRTRRVTPTDLKYKGSVVDEVKWRDAYSMESVSQPHFGNVTTAQVLNYATTGALTMKERKVNAITLREVYTIDHNGELLPSKVASNLASDILLDIALDPFIGRRKLEELDVQDIYSTMSEIEAYFGTDKAVQFSYTFDKSTSSFEETFATVCSAVFCEGYRQGSLISTFFERETEDTVLLFNHRNKLPGSEKRHIRFGNLEDYNGVIYSFTDPENNDTLSKITLSADGETPTNPKEVEGVGIRNRLQAYFQAMRIWQKIQHQNKTTAFDATQEGEILIKGNRILVTDSTRNITQDGYVKSQELLVLTLSQDFKYEQGKQYSINLQLTDATVENIPITPTTNKRQIVLQRAPSIPLYITPSAYNDCRYIIFEHGKEISQAFIVSEKKSNDNMTTSISAYNYSSLYYKGDKDYINNVVDSNGYPI